MPYAVFACGVLFAGGRPGESLVSLVAGLKNLTKHIQTLGELKDSLTCLATRQQETRTACACEKALPPAPQPEVKN